MLGKLIQILTSLRLTVILLALGIVVIFFGTLAQVTDGLYNAQHTYFRSWFSVWSAPSASWFKLPLPGGYLLGVLLLLNLIAAHIKRFQFSWKKSGIILAHLGIILLLIGQLATDLFARESRMSFAEGESRNYTEDFQDFEVAFFTDVSSPDMERVVAFSGKSLRSDGVLKHPDLGFDVRIKKWMPNSEPAFRAPMLKNKPPQATEGIAQSFDFKSVPLTVKMDDKNIPSAIVEVLDRSGKSLGTWAVSGWSGDIGMAKAAARSWAKQFGGDDMASRIYLRLIADQSFRSEGKSYRMTLRPVRYYETFAVDLLKTTHEFYPGTDIPRNFQSRVRLDNPATQERREVDIYMNNPLRYRGLTFFQSQMGNEELNGSGRGTSVFQVVRNPTWLTPYLGCGLVGTGLLVQFLTHLVRFIAKRGTAK